MYHVDIRKLNAARKKYGSVYLNIKEEQKRLLEQFSIEIRKSDAVSLHLL